MVMGQSYCSHASEVTRNVRNIVDHEKFREALAKEMPCRNKLYSYGHRKTSILHSRIRMGCSALTGHLYNYHVVENPRCDCGAPMEDSFHYFFECPRFIIQRDAMMVSIAEITNCTIGTLLFGNDCCTLDENKAVFDIVHYLPIQITISSHFDGIGCKRGGLNGDQRIVRNDGRTK